MAARLHNIRWFQNLQLVAAVTCTSDLYVLIFWDKFQRCAYFETEGVVDFPIFLITNRIFWDKFQRCAYFETEGVVDFPIFLITNRYGGLCNLWQYQIQVLLRCSRFLVECPDFLWSRASIWWSGVE